jgi:Domain of unknown function (DUF4386)
MLKLSDSRNFGRTFAGLALIAAPVLFLVGTAVDPAWADDTEEYLNEVAADKGLYLLAGILNLVGALLLIAGLLGVIHLLRRRRVTVGQIGAALVMIGAVAIASTYTISVIELVGSGDEFDRGQVVRLLDDAEESGEAAPIFVMFLLGLVLGSILLAIGLWRQKAVPVWVPIVLVLSSLAGFVTGDSQVSSLITSAILAVALIAIGLRILAVSDDDWERWEVLSQERAPREASVA